MVSEPLSPELALVDPDLAARARAALPERAAPVPQVPTPAPLAPPGEPRGARRSERSHPYPLWARVTAALWLVVLGILIGGAAIPHAQDLPRVVPPAEEIPANCTPETPQTGPVGVPTSPGR